MDLTLNDFYTEYSEREFKRVKLTTWKGAGDGFIHLLRMTKAEEQRATSIAQKVSNFKSVNLLSGMDSVQEYEEDLDYLEDYLITTCLCNSKGELSFKDFTEFKKWKAKVTPEVANEIVFHIDEMNELYGGFPDQEKVIKELKKK